MEDEIESGSSSDDEEDKDKNQNQKVREYSQHLSNIYNLSHTQHIVYLMQEQAHMADGWRRLLVNLDI